MTRVRGFETKKLWLNTKLKLRKVFFSGDFIREEVKDYLKEFKQKPLKEFKVFKRFFSWGENIGL